MVPDLAFHGLGGTSAQYYELKGLRASKNTYPRGPNTGVAKRAASVQVEHVRKLRKLDQKLYGTDIDSASPPGPLLRRFHALGEVHPIVFGAYGEVSEGMEVLIGKLADAWAPQIADQYLLDNVLAAEGIARSILREEIGAACFNAHAHILLGRTKFCQPGYGAAYGRRRDQDERFNRARAQEQEARGTGRHRAFGGMPPRRWSF